MATHEDANLLVQLAQWGAMIDLGMAMGTVFGDEFDPGSPSPTIRPSRRSSPTARPWRRW